MQKQECDYLVKQKLEVEKKPIKQIYQEIENLKQSQKLFKIISNENKSLKLKIFNQEKQIKTLKDQLTKQKKKMFDLTLKKDIKLDNEKTEKNYNGKNANVHHLKRILSYLEENPKVIKTRIKENCCLNFEQLNSGLMFLERINLIKQVGANYEKKEK